MRKLIFIGALIFVCFTQTSFTTAGTERFSKTYKETLLAKKMPYVVYVPISNTISLGGCDFTVTQMMAYVFNDNFILVGVYVSQNFYVSVDCGGGSSNLARYASDMSFDVSNNQITDVHFATTGVREVDELYSNSSFKTQYLNSVRNHIPK